MFFTRSSSRRNLSFRPMLEMMEDRVVPSTSPIDAYSGDARPTIEIVMPVDGTSSDDYVSPGEKQGFNPQPDPPGIDGYVAPGEAEGFNPQPDPPGIDGSELPRDQNSADPPGSREGFNPQPDPPGVGDPFVGDPFVGDPFVGDPFRTA